MNVEWENKKELIKSKIRNEKMVLVETFKTNIIIQIILARFKFIKKFKEFKFYTPNLSLRQYICIELEDDSGILIHIDNQYVEVYKNRRIINYKKNPQYLKKIAFESPELVIYICDNYDKIVDYNINLKKRREIIYKNYLKATEFLLCTKKYFPRDIRYIIANKILFFLFFTINNKK